jgi:hypothetical protein
MRTLSPFRIGRLGSSALSGRCRSKFNPKDRRADRTLNSRSSSAPKSGSFALARAIRSVRRDNGFPRHWLIGPDFFLNTELLSTYPRPRRLPYHRPASLSEGTSLKRRGSRPQQKKKSPRSAAPLDSVHPCPVRDAWPRTVLVMWGRERRLRCWRTIRARVPSGDASLDTAGRTTDQPQGSLPRPPAAQVAGPASPVRRGLVISGGQGFNIAARGAEWSPLTKRRDRSAPCIPHASRAFARREIFGCAHATCSSCPDLIRASMPFHFDMGRRQWNGLPGQARQ